MKASELRIGNWVKRNGLVVQCDYMSAANCHAVPIQYEPIPITEEWLVRFGFERVNQQYPHKKIYRLNKFYIKFDIKDSFFYWAVYGANTDYTIELVHQLQNLYFALTGEELELK